MVVGVEVNGLRYCEDVAQYLRPKFEREVEEWECLALDAYISHFDRWVSSL